MLDKKEELLLAIYGLLLLEAGHNAGILNDKVYKDRIIDLKDLYNQHLDELAKGEKA